MSSTTSQAAIAETNHTLPTRLSAYQGKISADPVIKAFRHIWENESVAPPPISQAGHLSDAFDANMKAALDGENPIAALDSVAEAWEQLRAGS